MTFKVTGMDLRLSFDEGVEVVVHLREDDTPTRSALLASLPFGSQAMRWGDEVYFCAPFLALLEKDAREEMSVGDVAYWPDGSAIAVFFGPTPASTDGLPKAYSRCNIIGTAVTDISGLKRVRQGARVKVSKSE